MGLWDRCLTVLVWPLLAVEVIVLLALPWLDCQLNPPFGRSWWYRGGSGSCGDTPGQLLAWGAFMGAMFVISGLVYRATKRK